ERFLYGRAKAEYFSAAVEGLMIFVAAAVILVTAVERFLNPRPLENLGMGLVIVVLASLINGGVAVVLLRAGKEHNSITLPADVEHLMPDVVTSAGVLLGVARVALTGWERLDALVAFAVGGSIVFSGIGLLGEFGSGLLDKALPDEDHDIITAVLRW